MTNPSEKKKSKSYDKLILERNSLSYELTNSRQDGFIQEKAIKSLENRNEDLEDELDGEQKDNMKNSATIEALKSANNYLKQENMTLKKQMKQDKQSYEMIVEKLQALTDCKDDEIEMLRHHLSK